MVRAFASDQCGLDSNPSEVAARHILLKFGFGFHPCPERFFSDTSVFSCPQKRTISNSVRFGIVDEKPQCTFANTKLIYLFMYDHLSINFFLFVYLTAFITSTSINGKGQFQDVGDYFEYYKRQLAIYAIFFAK